MSEVPEGAVQVTEAHHWRYMAAFYLSALYDAERQLGKKDGMDVELARQAYKKTHDDIAGAYGLNGDDCNYNMIERGFVRK